MTFLTNVRGDLSVGWLCPLRSFKRPAQNHLFATLWCTTTQVWTDTPELHLPFPVSFFFPSLSHTTSLSLCSDTHTHRNSSATVILPGIYILREEEIEKVRSVKHDEGDSSNGSEGWCTARVISSHYFPHLTSDTTTSCSYTFQIQVLLDWIVWINSIPLLHFVTYACPAH